MTAPYPIDRHRGELPNFPILVKRDDGKVVTHLTFEFVAKSFGIERRNAIVADSDAVELLRQNTDVAAETMIQINRICNNQRT